MIIVLTNQNNEILGIYNTSHTSFDVDFDKVFKECIQEAYNNSKNETKGDVHDDADKLLAERGIIRIDVKEIYVDENDLE